MIGPDSFQVQYFWVLVLGWAWISPWVRPVIKISLSMMVKGLVGFGLAWMWGEFWPKNFKPTWPSFRPTNQIYIHKYCVKTMLFSSFIFVQVINFVTPIGEELI